jgi:hypothetical protein
LDGASVGVRLVAARDAGGDASRNATSATTIAAIEGEVPIVPALRDERVQGMTPLEQQNNAEVALPTL